MKSRPYEHSGNGVRGACYGCEGLSFLAGDRAIALFTGMAEGGGPLLRHRVAGDGPLGMSAVVALSLVTLACSLLLGVAFNSVVLAGQKRRARPAKRTRLDAAFVSARLGCCRTRCVTFLCLVPVAGGVAASGRVFTNLSSLEAAITLFTDNPADATSSHGPISDWDVSEVTDMKELFKGKGEFNENISGWNTSRVTNMDSIFKVRFVCMRRTSFARPVHALPLSLKSLSRDVPPFQLGTHRKRRNSTSR